MVQWVKANVGNMVQWVIGREGIGGAVDPHPMDCHSIEVPLTAGHR